MSQDFAEFVFDMEQSETYFIGIFNTKKLFLM